ncbi:uncharacterized protein LOC111132750 [Crassostrea virginica]
MSITETSSYDLEHNPDSLDFVVFVRKCLCLKNLTQKLIREAQSPPTRCVSTQLPEVFEYDPSYKQKLTDDITWTNEGFDNQQEQCLVIIDGDVTLWVTIERGAVAPPPPPPPPEITGAICPNNCHSNGTCVEGVCVCDHPWIGDDCSVNMNDALDLDIIGSGVPCDLNRYACNSVNLYGDNFAEVENLTCHYRNLAPNLTVIAEAVTSPAEYLNTETVVCTLPGEGLYQVAVSNNGQTTSPYQVYIIYNSYCHHCTQTEGCRTRTDICVIEGVCYENGFVNPQQKNQACRPEYSTDSWTTLRVDVIYEYRLFFLRIDGNFLVTEAGNLNQFGNMQLRTNRNNKKSLTFNGVDQFLAAAHQGDQCLSDPDFCYLGVTFPFTVRFIHLGDDELYVYSSCGSNPNSVGFDLRYVNKQFIFTASTRSREWSVEFSDVKTDVFYAYQFSWSVQYGLVFYVDGLEVARTTKYTTRDVSVPTKCHIFIGTDQTRKKSAAMELEYLHILLASKDILLQLGYMIGFPELTTNPSLRVMTDSSEQAHFLCEFTQLAADVDYIVEFYVDGRMAANLTNTSSPVIAHEVDVGDLHYGSSVYCEVSACYRDRCTASRGPVKRSSINRMAIQFEEDKLVVYEGQRPDKPLRGRLLVPPRLFCPADSRYTCHLSIVASLDTASRETKCLDGSTMQQLMFRSPQTNRSLCSYPVQWGRDVEIEIEATVDMIKDGKKTRTVQIQLMIMVGSTTQLFDVARIPVEIRDAKSVGMCKSINDPHITTFDKRKYDNFFEGEFVMYRHKTLPYAVHTFYRSCNKRASCNCAVAVRSGDDVIVLDVCGQTRSTGKKKRRPLTKKLFLNGELTPGTSVFQHRKGKKYEINLPTGGQVIIKPQGQFINVWMKGSPLDQENIEGLCGNFDGDKDNDLVTKAGKVVNKKQPDEFSREWRVPSDESLYSGFCGQVTVAEDQSSGSQYCECGTGLTPQCQASPVSDCGSFSKASSKKKGKSKKLVDITQELIEESQAMICESTITRITFEFNITYIFIVSPNYFR